MNTERFPRAYLLSALCVAGLLGCSSPKQASTEVENEMQVASISGVAATGYAMQRATWEVYSPTGKILAHGTTDSLGAFAGVVDSVLAEDIQPWLVRVADSTDTVTALFSADTTVGGRDSLFGLVNPVTDFVVRRALGVSARTPRAGYLPPSREQMDSLGNKAVSAIFGTGVTWAQFSHDHGYRPALPEQDSNYAPSPSDALLHSLMTNAERRGITRTQLLDSLYGDDNFQILSDSTYQIDLATAMAVIGVAPDQAREKLAEWKPADAPPGDSTALMQYLNVRAASDDSLPPDSGQGVVGSATEFLLSSYEGSARDSVQSILPATAQLFTRLVPPGPPPAASEPNKDGMQTQELARMLAELDAYIWVAQFGATTNLVERYFAQVVQPHPIELGAVPTSEIRAWIQAQWNKPAAFLFTVNPLRAPRDNVN